MNPMWKPLKTERRLLILTLLLATINQVFSLLDPQVFRLIVDNYASKFDTMPPAVFFKGVLVLLLLGIGVAFVSRVAKNFQDYYVNVITQRVGTGIYARSVEHVFSLPYAVFEDQRSGEVLQKLQRARDGMQAIITSAINIVFLSMIGILFVIVYAFTVSWIIGVTYIMLIPLLAFTTFAISRRIKAAQKSVLAESSELAGTTTETLRNVELVKSLGLESQEIGRLNTVNSRILQLELKKVKMIRKLSFIQGTLINFLRATLLFIMLLLIAQHGITLGQFFSLFIYSFFIFGPLAEFGTIAAQYQEAKASNEQLEQILKVPAQKVVKDPVPLGPLKAIAFHGAGFRYASAKRESLQGINMTIHRGETVAFVGPSGSGKSTLVKLLVGLYPLNAGTLRINGIDTKRIDFVAMRKRIGLVSQETQLFAGTIKENLLFVSPHASDKECMQALKLASATSILVRGGKGLQTKIGEGGIKISGGERQRLAIARALLRRPDLIIFDEATSSLDSLTEKEITRTIRRIMDARPNLMMVLVAHRLSTVVHSDRIYVLRKGRIVEQGTHRSLIKKRGLYNAFWTEQMAGGNGEDGKGSAI